MVLNDLFALFFPTVCEVCGRQLTDGEDVMCLHCLAEMPRTDYHRVDFNTLHGRLMGKARIERAAAWFNYHRRGEYVPLIHKTKYRGLASMGRRLARMYAREIAPEGFFDGIDVILPVPMHAVKELRREYNQAEKIAQGLSDITNVPIGDNLRARRGHKTQTRRGAYERYVNVKGLFEVTHPEELEGRHVLVVDDVITTGSTILACCEALAASVPGVRISVLTLASASMV